MKHKLFWVVTGLILSLNGLVAEPPAAPTGISEVKRKNTNELIRRVIAHPHKMGLPEDQATALRIGDPLVVVQKDYDEKCVQVIEETEYTSEEKSSKMLARAKIDFETPTIPVVGMQAFGTWDEKVGWGWRSAAKEQLTTIAYVRLSETKPPVTLKQGKGFVESDGTVTVECDVSVSVHYENSEGAFTSREIEGGLKTEAKVPFLGGGVNARFSGDYLQDKYRAKTCARRVASQFGSAQIWLPKGQYPVEFLTNLCREYGNIIGDVALEAQRTNRILSQEMAIREEACDVKRKCPKLEDGEKDELIKKWVIAPPEPKMPLLDLNIRGSSVLQGRIETERERKESYQKQFQLYQNADRLLSSALERTCQYHPGKSGMVSHCDIVLKKGSVCFKPSPAGGKDHAWKNGVLDALSEDELRSRFLGHRWEIPCRADTECWGGFCRTNEDIRKELVQKYEQGFPRSELKSRILKAAKHAYTPEVQKIIDEERSLREKEEAQSKLVVGGGWNTCRSSLIQAIDDHEDGEASPLFRKRSKTTWVGDAVPSETKHLDTYSVKPSVRYIDGERNNPYRGLRGCDLTLPDFDQYTIRGEGELSSLTVKPKVWGPPDYRQDNKAKADQYCSIWAIQQSASPVVCGTVKDKAGWADAHCLNHYKSDLGGLSQDEIPGQQLCVQHCSVWLNACCGPNPPANCKAH